MEIYELMFKSPSRTKSTSETYHLPQVQKAFYLGVVADSNLKSSVQLAESVFKAYSMLAMFNRTVAHLIPEVFISPYSAFVHSQLDYCIHAWSASLHRDVRRLERLQQKGTRIVPGLHHESCEERLQSLDKFSFEFHRF